MVRALELKSIGGQHGRVVRALELKSVGHVFKSCSDR